MLVSALMLLFAAGSACAQHCALKRIASIPMTPSSDGGMTIPVTIDGTVRKFFVDPSWTWSAVFADAATQMDLRVEQIGFEQIYDEKGKRIDHYVVVPSFAVGESTGSHLHFLLQPREGERADVAGILGTDVLKSFDVDFDFAAGTLNLFSPDHCKGRVVYWARDYVDISYVTLSGGVMEIPVTLDGHDFGAIIHTGDNNSYLDAVMAHRIYDVDDNSPGATPLKNAKPGDSAQFGYRFKSLSMEGVTVSNPFIGLMRNEAEKAFERDEGKVAKAIPGDELERQDMSIGLDILSKLHLYIAYGERKIYLTAADAGKAPGQTAPAH